MSSIREFLSARDEYITRVKEELLGPGSEISIPDSEHELITNSPDVRLNSTPFVRQYDILFNKWGVLLCQKEYQTNDIRRNSREWL